MAIITSAALVFDEDLASKLDFLEAEGISSVLLA